MNDEKIKAALEGTLGDPTSAERPANPAVADLAGKTAMAHLALLENGSAPAANAVATETVPTSIITGNGKGEEPTPTRHETETVTNEVPATVNGPTVTVTETVPGNGKGAEPQPSRSYGAPEQPTKVIEGSDVPYSPPAPETAVEPAPPIGNDVTGPMAAEATGAPLDPNTPQYSYDSTAAQAEGPAAPPAEAPPLDANQFNVVDPSEDFVKPEVPTVGDARHVPNQGQ